ncbi:MAG: hypothetical protein Q8R81_04535 [Novosphingobium sp.]|uniref:hypothetical protein n=1 Tax=Novosphingobium sp. TaxID=1874826 RepID=UPI0027372518|nr:hypothetical protein [Novosphingobium sp.]MDP3549644.1 hypothetical protein [Novosphingobium sp.]
MLSKWNIFGSAGREKMEIWIAVERLKEALEIIDRHDLPMAGIHVTNALQSIELALGEEIADVPPCLPARKAHLN